MADSTRRKAFIVKRGARSVRILAHNQQEALAKYIKQYGRSYIPTEVRQALKGETR